MNKVHSTLKWLFYFLSIVVAGKLSGFLKDILITSYYGVSDVSDAYFFSMSVSALVYIAVYSAIPIIVVPLATAKTDNRDRAQTLNVAFLYFLAITLVTVLFAVFVIPFLLKKQIYSAQFININLAIDYLLIMSVGYLFASITSFYNAIQIVNGVTLYSYIVPLCNNIIFCLGLILFPSEKIKYALIFANFSWMLLCVLNHKVTKQFFTFKLKIRKEDLINYALFLNIAGSILIFFLDQLNLFVGIYFAAQLYEGAVAVYSYANKLNALVLSLITLYLSTIVFPKFARISAHSSAKQMQESCMYYIKITYYVSFPIIFLVSFYCDEVVSLLFQRGKFNADDVIAVASVFTIFIMIIPFALLKDLLSKVCFSSGKTLKPLGITMIGFVINVFFANLWSARFGVQGLAMSTLLSVVVSYLAMKKLACKQFQITLLWETVHVFYHLIRIAFVPGAIFIFFYLIYHPQMYMGSSLFLILFVVSMMFWDKEFIAKFNIRIIKEV